jgi:hypothetical protein
MAAVATSTRGRAGTSTSISGTISGPRLRRITLPAPWRRRVRRRSCRSPVVPSSSSGAGSVDDHLSFWSGHTVVASFHEQDPHVVVDDERGCGIGVEDGGGRAAVCRIRSLISSRPGLKEPGVGRCPGEPCATTGHAI